MNVYIWVTVFTCSRIAIQSKKLVIDTRTWQAWSLISKPISIWISCSKSCELVVLTCSRGRGHGILLRAPPTLLLSRLVGHTPRGGACVAWPRWHHRRNLRRPWGWTWGSITRIGGICSLKMRKKMLFSRNYVFASQILREINSGWFQKVKVPFWFFWAFLIFSNVKFS